MNSHRRMIFTVLVIIASIGFSAWSWALPTEELDVVTSTFEEKVVKSRTQKMEAFCILETQGVENCGNLALGPVAFTTGPDAGQAAIVRLTVQYRTSPGDGGRFGASLGPVGEDHENMAPSAYFVSSSPSKNTETVTWLGENLAPDTEYSVLLSVNTVRKTGAESELIHFSSIAEVELTSP